MRQAIILMGLIFLLSSVVYADININQASWSFDYEIDVDSSKSKTFTFTNTDNVSRQVSLTDFGLGPVDLTFSFQTFSVPGSGTKDITIIAEVPSTASDGVENGGILITSESGVTIPTNIIDVTANLNNTDEEEMECEVDNDCSSAKICKDNDCVPKCRIEPLSTDVERIFKAESDISTEKFYIYMTKGCDGEPVIYKTAEFTGTVQTDSGKKPVRISSKQLTSKDYGDEPAEFVVTYDVVGVDNKVYTPKLTIIARHGDNTISTSIDFNIIVTGTITPISNSDDLEPPRYKIPAQVKVGDDFEIVVKDLNPNLQPQIFFTPYIVGTAVERKGSTWTWTGHINQTGKFDISITSLYNGGPIGGVYTKEVIVVQQLGQIVEGNLTFDLYPKLEDLVDDDVCTVLIRDSGNENIVADSLFYVNGVRKKDMRFTYDSSIKTQLSATHPNYLTADLLLVKNTTGDGVLKISFSPQDIEEGEIGMASVTNSVSGQLIQNLTLLYDDIVVLGGSFTAGTIGNHILKASSPGYMEVSVQVPVSPTTMILQSPDSLKKNKENTITLSKQSPWSVQWTSKDEEENRIVANGKGNQVIFKPEKSGVYEIYVRNRASKTYEMGGFDFNFKWSWWYLVILLIIIVIISVIYYGNQGGKIGGGRVGYGLPPSDGNIVSPIG